MTQSPLSTTPPARKPTEAELEILRVLWTKGSATVREIFDVLSQERAMGYTTVLKTMQIMHEKGLVTRTEEGKAHIYEAAMREGDMQGQLLKDLSDKLFSGSPALLAMHALSLQPASDEELQQIRALIERKRGA
ncbi:BlaI/MecI/CopY family transcriptional regulator [Asticcacaulis sp. 201]|uniref:BlaI/MecI/CopY family transcriptional regulator n=1 Tax=Asticcacaulis sp. 201 TaxID=3028787 RepID=UPI002916656F|nr:BlaI/MecI/CopY family transcriptional regulator [Asticcacaulis sp. 201]MDV6329354.1 BlaI/MecI/CopY family transcriptional regulator [Asticcacaulis sp. 201]